MMKEQVYPKSMEAVGDVRIQVSSSNTELSRFFGPFLNILSLFLLLLLGALILVFNDDSNENILLSIFFFLAALLRIPYAGYYRRLRSIHADSSHLYVSDGPTKWTVPKSQISFVVAWPKSSLATIHLKDSQSQDKSILFKQRSYLRKGFEIYFGLNPDVRILLGVERDGLISFRPKAKRENEVDNSTQWPPALERDLIWRGIRFHILLYVAIPFVMFILLLVIQPCMIK